jgi:hypothetical protein
LHFPRMTALVLLIVFALCLGGTALAADDDDDDRDDNQDGDQDEDANAQLKKKVETLEKRVAELENKPANAKPWHVKKLDWDADREGTRLANGWYFTFHGEFRSRALVEGNTRNAYTNFAGQHVYAYDPQSTFKNDYGWWDQRLLMQTIMNFGSTADLIMTMQLGDIVWGSQAPVMGGVGQQKFDQVDLFFRELYTRIDLDPIPMYLVFGRMPIDFLGNRLIMGNEHDGAYTYFGPKWLTFGIGAVRQYEGENYEMKMKWNDDEDTFFGWAQSQYTPNQRFQLFGWVNDWKVTQYPNEVAPNSPLWLLPEFDPVTYRHQESQQWIVGANWVGQFGPVTVNAEFDKHFGRLLANDNESGVKDMRFRGYGGILKTDWAITRADTLALTAGYGSGDDPDTLDYEGFFAPDNDFGIRDEKMDEYITRGYFSVYEHLSPGAGVPGRLRDDLGSGGIENTIFANLGLDLGFQDNHHYYLSWGHIRAAEENPDTQDAEIGWELDARVDYIFSNNVIFAIYGGHLFMTGEYFRRDAHDAAQMYFEWKLVW